MRTTVSIRRLPIPASLHGFPSHALAGPARRHNVLALALLFAISIETGFSQWQSFDRPGEDFHALAASESTLFALASPPGIHVSTDNGLTWSVRSWFVSATSKGFCLGMCDGILIGGASNGSYLSGLSRNWSRQAVAGVEDDIQAVASTRRGMVSTWYLGGFGGGVRRSTNAGGTWALCNEGLTDLNVTSFATMPGPGDSSQILFAGTYGGGVFRSDNDGLHWTAGSYGLCDLHVYAMAAHGDTLYASHSGGRVSRSCDGGTTWIQYGAGLPYTDVISLALATAGSLTSIYAGTLDSGVWRFSPASGTWEPMNAGLSSLRINAIIGKNNTLFVATERGIYRSYDGGSTWQRTDNDAVPLVNSIYAASFPSGVPATRLFVVTDPHYVYVEAYRGVSILSSRVCWSDDLGQAWTTVPFYPNFIAPGAHFELFAHQHRDCIMLFSAASHDADRLGFILSTDRGTTWGERFNGPFLYCGLTGAALRGISSEHRFETFITTGGGPHPGLARSLDSGRTWTSGPSFEAITSPLVSEDSSFYAACLSSALRTPNGGLTWDTITYHGVYPYRGSVPMLGLLYAADHRLLARVAPDIVPGEVGGLYASSDLGKNWIPAGFTGQPVDRIIGTDSILLALKGGHAFASWSSTLTWKDISENLTPDSLAVITASPEYLFALTNASDRIWYRPMSEIRTALREQPSQPVLFAPADGTTCDSTRMAFRWAPVPYASAYGIQLSEDPAFASGMFLDSSRITDTAFTAASLVKNHTYYWRVRAWNSNGFGPWSEVRHMAISPTATEVTAREGPKEFALLQNYPNPFNPVTTIGYQVPVNCRVTLTVFDLLGREMTVLVDERKAPGRYEARFDASRLSSGMYFYRMQVRVSDSAPVHKSRSGQRDIIQTRTLMLVR